MADLSMPMQFASAEPFEDAQLAQAPVRLPRPRLPAPLPATDLGPRAARALDTLGPPHRRRPARAPAPRTRGGPHRRDAPARRDRDGARRGPQDRHALRPPPRHEAARRGDRRRRDRLDGGLVLQPALARPALPARHAPAAARLRTDPRPLLRHRARARPSAGRRARRRSRQYPASEGIDSTRILALMREHRAAIADTLEPLPARLRAPSGCPTAPRRSTAAALPGERATPRAGAAGSPSTSCCSSSSRCCAAARGAASTRPRRRRSTSRAS